MTQAADELLHMIKQAVQQAVLNYQPFLYGHISTYDQQRHRVRVIIPSLRDDQGNVVHSPWMPLATHSVGGGYGMQVIPFGGATIEAPTKGEQVLIGIFNRQSGVGAVLGSFYGSDAPPATELPQGASQPNPGDVLLKGSAGDLIRISPGHSIDVYAGKLNVTVYGDVTAAVQGDMKADVQGKTTLTSKGDLSVGTQGNATVAASGTAVISGSDVHIGAAGGRRVVLDGDPCSSGGRVSSTATKAYGT